MLVWRFTDRNFTNTNLKKHLFKYHKKEYEEFTKLDDQYSKRTVKAAGAGSSTSQPTLQRCLSASKPYDFDQAR